MKFKRSIELVLIALLAIGCSSKTPVVLSPPCAVPAHLGDGWETITAAQAGFDERELCSVLSSSVSGKNNVHAVLIERHHRIASELYLRGQDRPINFLYGLNPFPSSTDFDARTLHDIRSISKTVISLAIGIAQDRGAIGRLDEPVLKFYPDLADLTKTDAHSITLENLLTMSSGLRWDEGALPNDETRLYWKKDQARFLLERSIVAPPGHVFNYNSGGNAILADVLSRSTGEPWLEFVRKNLFEPLGIKTWEWVRDVHDRPLSFTGLRLLPRDMLKLGRLALDRGQWNGQRIVRSEWIEASLRPHLATGIRLDTTPPEDLEYGYQWWSGTVQWRNKKIRWSAAFGNGGQRIFVVPELDATIVILAGEYNSHDINRVVNQLFENIVATLGE